MSNSGNKNQGPHSDHGDFAADQTRSHSAQNHSGANDLSNTAALRAQILQQQTQLESLQQRFHRVESERNQWQSRARELARIEEDLRVRERDLRFAEAAVERNRSSLREQVQREIEVERTALLQLQSTLQQEKVEYEQRLKVKEAEYNAALQNLDDKLAEKREQLKAELREEISKEVLQEKAELSRVYDEFESSRQISIEEIQRQTAELEEQRQEFDLQLQLEREQLEKALERQRHDLQNEKSLFQKRYRFQFDHLQQSREELETSLRAFRREESQLRIDARRFDDIHQMRQRQLERLLNVVRQREESIQRQASVMLTTVDEQKQELARERARFVTRQDLWNQEKESREKELQRRMELLEVKNDNLALRRRQLEELREDIERTHQSTLETRLAIEETHVRISRELPDEEARAAIESARSSMHEQHLKMSETLTKRRHELAGQVQRLQQQQQELAQQKKTIAATFSQREQELQQQLSTLSANERTIDDVNAQWQTARDKWKQERLEAETIIRGLLEQLTDRELADIESERSLLAHPEITGRLLPSDDSESASAA